MTGDSEKEPVSRLRPASGKRLILVVLFFYAALVLGGHWIATHLEPHLLVHGMSAGTPKLTGLIVGAVCIYIIATALPFVPGAEIGMSLILLFGVQIVPVVFLATVLSLVLAFIVGRQVSERRLELLFKKLGLHRASVLLRDFSHLKPSERVDYLVLNAPSAWLPWLIKHNFLALIILINLLGNTILGGGGGIAMTLGICRIMPLPKLTLCVMLAVCPIPLAILMTSFMFQ